MAMGAVVAYCSFSEMQGVMRALTYQITEIVALAAATICLALGARFPFYDRGVYAALLVITILNAAQNPTALVRLENPVLRYLGKISYRLYVYHVLAFVIVIRACEAVGLYGNVLVLTGTLLVIVLLAAASYAFDEIRFLNLKARVMRVASGTRAASTWREATGSAPRRSSVTDP